MPTGLRPRRRRLLTQRRSWLTGSRPAPKWSQGRRHTGDPARRRGDDPLWTTAEAETRIPTNRSAGVGFFPVVPGYEILRELGRGGMGVVYQARHVQLDRVVALKMILAGAHAGEQELARFRTEAEAVARLQHPGIVQIHDVGDHNGLPYFSLEYCSGGSLEDSLRDAPFQPREAAAIVEKLARAIQVAHEANVIHRDLKPANVLLAADGTPKITDFGLARKLDEAGHTLSGTIMGTPSYMAPEQAGGERSAVGPAADVYALGGILYDCLTGRPPFKAATAMDTILQVLSDVPVPPGQIQSLVPKDLETICLKCLQKDPRLRYAHAEDLADDLRRYQNAEPIRARPIGVIGRAWRWCRRHPAVATLLVLIAAVLLAGTTISTYFAIQASRRAKEAQDIAAKEKAQRERADRRTEEAQQARQAEQRQRTEAEKNLSASLIREAEALRRTRSTGYQPKVWDRLQRAMALGIEEPDRDRIRQEAVACLGDFAGLEPLTLVRKDLVGSGGQAVFLSDQTIVSGSSSGALLFFDAVSGKETGRLTGHRGSVRKLCAARRGKTLLVADSEGNLKRWDRGENQQWNCAWTLRLSGISSLTPLPDGESFAVSYRTSTIHHVELRSMEDGAVLSRFTDPDRKLGWRAVAVSPDGSQLAGVSTGGGRVCVWEVKTGRIIARVDPPEKGRSSSPLQYSLDGRFLTLGFGAGIVLWQTKDYSQWSSLRRDTIANCAFSPDGQHLAFSTVTSVVILWHVPTQRQVATLKHPGPLSSLSSLSSLGFSPDGTRLLSAGPGAIRLWKVTGLQEKTVLRGHAQAVPCVAFHPDGATLASGATDGTVSLWGVGSGKRLQQWKAAAGPVQTLSFSATGELLATGSDLPDAAIRIWSTSTFRQIATLSYPLVRDIYAVRFSPDGKWVVATGSAGLRVWKMESPAPASPLGSRSRGR